MNGLEFVDGIILTWFSLTALSVLFVAIDIWNTPEDPVLKWGFILLTAYIGPFGVFLYVFGCREPLPGLHEKYIATRWRQVLGSTMHCVAGDGIGILAGAIIGAVIQLSGLSEILLEYVLGFGFGWAIFQALAMKAMLGSYKQALAKTFYAELVSMNWLMAGMMPTMMILMRTIEGAEDPTSHRFWFVMSMSLLVGFIAAYPINWWLVSRGLKHGMMTVRPHESMVGMDTGAPMDTAPHDTAPHQAGAQPASAQEHTKHSENHKPDDQGPAGIKPSTTRMLAIATISFGALAAGITFGMSMASH